MLCKMDVNKMQNNAVWFSLFRALKNKGKIVSPRGQKILEIEDHHFDFFPLDTICPFNERKINLTYNLAEFSWYLSGDPNDNRMESLSKFWKTIKNETFPFYNSNYGKYFFQEQQFFYVVQTLQDDKDSRQATIVLNKPEIMMSNSKDKVCTNAINFRIRDNKLNMSVQMRSNDIIKGLGVDSHMFSLLYEMVYLRLCSKYFDLEIGNYHHTASSFHIYEKDWVIMESIIENGGSNCTEHDIPRINGTQEVMYLLTYFPRYARNVITGQFENDIQTDPRFKFSNFAFNKFNQIKHKNESK